jgi:Domain of unknown function (DUF222)
MGTGLLNDAIDALEHTPFEHAIIDKFVCLDRLVASIVTDLDTFDRDNMWAVCGSPSLKSWLKSSCRRTGGEAGAYVRTISLLRSLPVTAEAFADGTLSKGHVEVISANVTDRTIALFAEVEAEMVARLADLSISDSTTVMKIWASHANQVADEDGKAPADREIDNLYISPMLNGRDKIDGQLEGENAKIFRAGIAACMADPVEGEPIRTLPQRQADALVEMARRALQTTTTTVRRSTDFTLLLNVDPAMQVVFASYADGTIVPVDRLQRLLCDGVITPIMHGDNGQSLWMGRSVRTATDAQRRALVARDRGCAFPGCHRPAAWTEAHHVHAWDPDGLTDIDNMCLLCTSHHTLIHKPGWHAKLTADQTLEVTTPTGRVLRAPPRTHIHQPPARKHPRSRTTR